ncbi:MAG: GNAT family N-acetyltransferase [Pseudomonadota bacterium]
MDPSLLSAPGGLPVIETPRLRLRPRRMSDLADCLALDRTPGTTRWIDGPWDDPVAHEAFVRARIRGPYPPGHGYWVVARHQHPGEFLGWVLLIPEDAKGPRTEIGWRLLPEARGKGYAPEAAANLLAHGFSSCGLREVVAEIHRDNASSRRVAEKIGMKTAEDPAEGAPQCLLYRARVDCAR